MKYILSKELFEQVYLNDVKPFAKDNKHPKGLRFVNRDEALKSVKRLQEMLDKKEIEVKDAIIAAYIISKRAESHPSKKSALRDGYLVWQNYLAELKKKDPTIK